MESFQNFIQTNNGSKIDIKPNFFQVDYAEKTIIYKLSNSEVENKMKFKDFDFILIGKNKFKTYKLNSSKEIDGFFVLCQTATKTLVFSTNSVDDSDIVHYVFHIIDLNNNIMESVQFDNEKKPKSVSVRGDIFSKMQFYFGDCSSLIKRISLFDNTSLENFNLDILGFFDTPVYIECL
jgi:hypothetical protein